MLSTPIDRLRFAGLWEGISSILLFCVAMPLKYAAGQDWAVKIVGSVHGFLFIVFVAAVLHVSIRLGWWGWKWILATATASIVPGATFILDIWLKKQQQQLATTNGTS